MVQAIRQVSNLSEQEEAFYRAEMGSNYAPLDPPTPLDENTIGFEFLRYPTLHEMALSDARIKICIGPAGCLPADTEVMTRNGWVRIDQPQKEILCYNPDTREARFSAVEHVSYPCEEGFTRFYKGHTLDMTISDEHKVKYIRGPDYRAGRNEWHTITGEELSDKVSKKQNLDMHIPTVFDYTDGCEYPLTDDQLRICVMLAADGYLPNRGRQAHVSVNRQYKKERVRQLLLSAGITWREDKFKTRPNTIRFVFAPPEWSKDLTRFYTCNKRQLQIIADESLYWDGSFDLKKGSKFSTSDRRTADFMQFVYVSTGVPSAISVTEYSGAKAHWRPTYVVSYRTSKRSAFTTLRDASSERVEAIDGKKYCYQTPTGMFVVRQNGKVFVTGNSAKTSGIIWQLIIKALEQHPAADGVRYSKALVARNTASMLKSTTIPSFKTMAGNLMTFRTGSFPMMGYLRCDLNDGTKVHLDVEFLSFDTEESQTKLLGCEPTFAFVDEVSEVPESLVLAINRRLGRFPNGRFGKATWVGLLGATNGPLKNHWLYQWSLGKTQEGKPLQAYYEDTDHEGNVYNRRYFELFRQPPALLRQPDGTWKKNAFAENVDNLPGGYGYYINMLNDPEQKIKAYVEGDFADLVTGKVVYPEFNESRHVIPNFRLPHGAPLWLSFDFGRTPVCLVATSTAGGRLIVIDEIMGEDMSIDTLMSEHVKPLLRTKYPNNLVMYATADPAGLSEAQSVDVSPFDVLVKHGIPVESPGSNKIQPRLESVKQKLTKLDKSGEPQLQITDNCRYLIEGIKYNYIYESVRGRYDMVRDTPTKSHDGWVSDLLDALGYLSMYHNLVSYMGRKSNRSSTKRARFI